jgi:ribosomal protein S18 acetylase RimI-like enzyme
MSERAVVVRLAEPRDLAEVSKLAGELVRMHHAVDPQRFLLVDGVEEGYAWWLGRQIKNKDAVVLVATDGPRVVGYAYGTIEERDWNMLLDAHGAVQDILVAKGARRAGVGGKLLDAMIRELEGKGVPRVVLSTMVGNAGAQRLFRTRGFRPTMLEMTRERGGEGKG